MNIQNIFNEILKTVWGYIAADWYILLAGILIACYVTVYVDTNKLKGFFKKKSGISIPGAVAFGALTPLCACGTTAVMISMFVSALPWGPVMAFMISSPLTSPSEYLFETAFLGSRFATSMLISSFVLGIGAGLIAHFLEQNTSFFDNQFRIAQEPVAKKVVVRVKNKAAVELKTGTDNELGCGCSRVESESELVACCSEAETVNDGTKPLGFFSKYKLDKFFYEVYNTGVKKILFYFIIFIAVGKFIEFLIPKEWIMMLFSSDKSYSIPLAALLGLPLYLTDASALPLMKSFISSGASEGAVLAFLIAGKATGVPVIAGMATLMKKRALLFYVGVIFVGAIIAGYAYQFIFSVM